MSAKVDFEIAAANVRLRLSVDGKPLIPCEWPARGPVHLQPVVERIFARLSSLEEQTSGNDLIVPHDIIADLSFTDASGLGLPPLGDLVLDVSNKGTIDRPDFAFQYKWVRPSGQAVIVSERRGAFIRIGASYRRLPGALFRLVDAMDRFNAIAPASDDARYAAWSDLQHLLPEGAHEQIRAAGYLRSMRIAYARAFSLRIDGDSSDPQLFPDLHDKGPSRSDGEGVDVEPDVNAADKPSTASLLPDHYRELFAKRVFAQFRDARPSYALGGGWYVVLAPALHRALQTVKHVARQPAQTRRDFIRNPRAWLAGELNAEYDDTVVESLFVETIDYSERVKGLGLWQPKVLPWIVQAKEPWLPPRSAGLSIGGKVVAIPETGLGEAISALQDAMKQGLPSVSIGGETVPATSEALDALQHLKAQFATPIEPDKEKPRDQSNPDSEPSAESRGRQVLLIEDNLDALTYERNFARRTPALPATPPGTLRTSLKPHQRDGLSWMQGCWQEGRPGVLLADDMGLGKTLQVLAFLAWLRSGAEHHPALRRPMLVVAPTGLLVNWQKEAALHLQPTGLGAPLVAYGGAMAELRTKQGPETLQGGPVLDLTRLAEATWILTTYEAVRDYQISFGRIPFAVVAFDEVQKIKTPGTLVTEAAKALRANFTIAMTGTPIENRLADLWCLMDTIQPGLLGDLSRFSRKYERTDAAPDDIERLRHQLLAGRPPVPAIMCRRLKTETLEGLPHRNDHIIEQEMPGVQAESYRAAVNAARAGSGKGAMLRALQDLRSISLHPTADQNIPDAEYIAVSARYVSAFRVLDDIYARREKALLFIEFLDPLARLAGIIQRRYKLPRPPMIISGEVSGRLRQERVDKFQNESSVFDVILLTPKAGGVGLTLTAANHVIHLSRWWNPAVEDQCTDRIFRIGQSRDVHVYYPISILPEDREHSFDVRLHHLLERKRRLSRDLLAAPSATDQDARALFEETIGG
jgi:hypothetical protein